MPQEQPPPPPLPKETTEYITAGGARKRQLIAQSSEMAERPEVAIQAILAGIRDMQQLNMQLADRLAMG